VSLDAVLAAEDGRINLLAGRAGVDLAAMTLAAHDAVVPDPARNLYTATSLAVSTIGTPACGEMLKAWDASDEAATARQVVAAARKIFFGRGGDRFRATIAVARILDALREHQRNPDNEGALETLLDHEIEHEKDRKAVWGRMFIREPERSIRVVQIRLSRAVGEGAILQFSHRMWSDGRVFRGRRRRPPGGTILLDASSSMPLLPQDVVNLVRRAPAGTIAAYASRSRNMTWGRLTVLARGGWRVSDDDIAAAVGGGNVVDGPALQWLAAQPAPRVWISDGLVTGRSEKTYETLRTQCDLICASAHIRHVGSIEELRHSR
jgi:hypothetical protein